MATMSWQLSGDYVEPCSCDFLCLCPPSYLTVPPIKSRRNHSMVFHHTPHPANTPLALSRAIQSHRQTFGRNEDETSSRRNRPVVPFCWQSCMVEGTGTTESTHKPIT